MSSTHPTWRRRDVVIVPSLVLPFVRFGPTVTNYVKTGRAGMIDTSGDNAEIHGFLPRD